jgi:pimeloyl-ACP methyl ester carboxylesterase
MMLSYWMWLWMVTLSWLLTAVLIIGAIRVMFRTRAAEQRHPPIGQFIDVNGVRVHYLVQGPQDAPVLVLLHGNGAAIQDFIASDLMARAAKKYRVIAIDRPGFGYTDRPRLKVWTPDAQAKLIGAVLEKLGVSKAIVLGHSWGTLVALAFALRFPERTAGLVLACGYYFPTSRKDVWFLSTPAIPVIGDVLRHTVLPMIGERISEKVIRRIFAPRPVPQRFRDEFPLGLSLRPGTLRASAEETGLMVPSAAQMQGRYGTIRCPVAIIWADGDRIVEKEQGPRLKKAIPHAITREFSGVGHMAHYADPDRIVDSIDLVAAWQPRAELV